MKSFSFLAMSLLLGLGFAAGASANEADRYADSVSPSLTIFSPNNAVGAPDGKYADMIEKDDNILFNMGENEEGLGDLTMYYTRLDIRVGIRVEFFDKDMQRLDSHSDFLANAKQMTIPYDGTESYRYVRVTQNTDTRFKIDAVESEDVASVHTTVQPVDEIEQESVRGKVIVSPLGTRYVLDDMNNRYVFVGTLPYQSWGYTQEDLDHVGAGTLTGLLLNGVVGIRPGTYLLQNELTDELYAIDHETKVRKIANEQMAARLYGDNWRLRTVMISEIDLTRYVRGEDLNALLPSGSIVQTRSGLTYYINANGQRQRITQAQQELLRLNPLFIGTNLRDSELIQHYPDGGELEDISSIQFPY